MKRRTFDTDRLLWFRSIKVDLCSSSVGDQGVEQLGVSAEKRLQNGIFLLQRELGPRRLHAPLQSSHVLQDDVQRHYEAERRQETEVWVILKASRGVDLTFPSLPVELR